MATSKSLLLFSLLTATSLLATPPAVHKIEPPGWWIGHSWNPVRLLIEGRDLSGAQLAAAEGLTVGSVTVSTNGCWALVDVAIDANTAAGRRTLRLTATSGTADVPFDLHTKLPGDGRFQGFSPDDVLYLLMPDRFANGDRSNDHPAASPGLLDRTKPRHYHGGDFAGVIQRLPYLRDLGVTALWMTPWYDNVNRLNQLEKYTADNRRDPSGTPSTDYHGYGAVDFYGLEERFGDMATLRELVDAAHRLGLKIVQDQVANHTGPYHRWTTNAPTPTWYNGSVAQHLENKWETWSIVDPQAPEEKRRQTLEGWFINLLPDLNQNDRETSTYLIQNSLWWLDATGLDAVRQDTLPYVPRDHWARWTTAVKREHPQVTILGEMWDGNPKLVAFFQGGRRAFDGVDTGVDTLFDFPLCYAVRDVFAKGQPMTRLSETLAADTNYVNPRVLVTFLGLHDMPRFLNEDGADLTSLNLAYTFLLTTRGTPLLYYGDEIALRGDGDPDNRRDFPGGFPGDPQDAFTAAGRTPEQNTVFRHVQRLLGLRRELEPLRRGDLQIVHVSRDTFACVRRSDGRPVLVVIHNGRLPAELKLDAAAIGIARDAVLRDRLHDGGEIRPANGILHVTLPARSAAICAP